MKKLTVEKIRKELLGKEIFFADLDNFMMTHGYWSVFNDGVTEEIKETKSVIYTAVDSCECEVIINFTITIDNSEDEAKENFIMLITSVEKF